MADGDQMEPKGWMSDVQRVIALILVATFAGITILPTIRLIVTGDTAALVDMAKTLQAALVNMSLIALGFFFGSTMSKTVSDAGQQKIVEKLTSAPPAGPVAPVPSPVVAPEPWWNRLTDVERADMSASTDPKVAAFVTGPVSMKPPQAEIDYLVAQGLLTQERAAALG